MFNTVEGYHSVLWEMFSTVEGYHSVLWEMFNTFKGYHQYCRGIPFSTVVDINNCLEMPSEVWKDTIQYCEGKTSVLGDSVRTVKDIHYSEGRGDTISTVEDIQHCRRKSQAVLVKMIG